jgi:beta-lactamase regulating signal transducer with metallopeptidase domain
MEGVKKMGKIKNFVCKHKKKLSVMATAAVMAAMSAINCFAAEADTSVSSDNALQTALTSFTDALTNVQGNILQFIVAAIPTALAIFGVVVAVTKGIGFVKKLLGKAS